MADIDVGADAIDRATFTGSAAYTRLDTNNPANADGNITQVEIWAHANMTGVKVGLFSLVSGTTYKCRSAATLGNVTAGSKQTFSGLSLAVKVNDVIGFYEASGDLELGTAGANYYYIEGDKVTVDNVSNYTNAGAGSLSLYGAGKTPAGSSKGFITG